jgi:hypothetical protein
LLKLKNGEGDQNISEFHFQNCENLERFPKFSIKIVKIIDCKNKASTLLFSMPDNFNLIMGLRGSNSTLGVKTIDLVFQSEERLCLKRKSKVLPEAKSFVYLPESCTK